MLGGGATCVDVLVECMSCGIYELDGNERARWHRADAIVVDFQLLFDTALSLCDLNTVLFVLVGQTTFLALAGRPGSESRPDDRGGAQ